MGKNYCEFCGEKLDRSDIFCKECGAKVETDENIQDAIIDKDKTSKQETSNLLYIIIVLLVIIAIAGAFIIFQ